MGTELAPCSHVFSLLGDGRGRALAARSREVGAEARDDEKNVDHEELAQEPELIGTFH